MKSYRIDQPKPKPKHRTMQDTSTPGEIYIHNGCTANLAIPCWYLEMRKPIPAHPHDRMHHDMIGWPTPDHPDHCCQEWDFDRHHCRRTPHLKCCPPRCEHFIDMRRLIPIHLEEEGYEKVDVSILDSEKRPVEGIQYLTSIDESDDWVVRVVLDVNVPDLLIPDDGHRVYYYSVYLSRDGQMVRDLVAMGRLIVLPSPNEGKPA